MRSELPARLEVSRLASAASGVAPPFLGRRAELAREQEAIRLDRVTR